MTQTFFIRSLAYTSTSVVFSYFSSSNLLMGMAVSVINSFCVTGGKKLLGELRYIKQAATIVSLSFSIFSLRKYGPPLIKRCRMTPLPMKYVLILTLFHLCIEILFSANSTPSHQGLPSSQTREQLESLELEKRLQEKAFLENARRELNDDNISDVKDNVILYTVDYLNTHPLELAEITKPVRDALLARAVSMLIVKQEHAIDPSPSSLNNRANIESMTLLQTLSLFIPLKKAPQDHINKIHPNSQKMLLEHFNTYYLSPIPSSLNEAERMSCPQMWKCDEYLTKWKAPSLAHMDDRTKAAFYKRATQFGLLSDTPQ